MVKKVRRGMRGRAATFATKLRGMRKRVSAKGAMAGTKIKAAYGQHSYRRKALRGLSALAGVGLGVATANPLIGYGAYRVGRRAFSTKADREGWKAARKSRRAKSIAAQNKGIKKVGKAAWRAFRVPGKMVTGHYARSGAKRMRKWAGLK